MKLNSIRIFVITILVIGITAGTVAAQQAPPASTWQLKIGSVPVWGSVRIRMEDWDWFESTNANNDYTFEAALLRVGLGQQLSKLDWQVEGAFPLLVNIPDDAIAPAPEGQLGLGASYFAASGRQSGTGFIKQAFLRIKGFAGDAPSSLRFGRFDFAEGTEVIPADPKLAVLKKEHVANRLLGPFTFTHIQRSFDGVQYTRNTKDWNLTVLGGRPVEGVFQLDGWSELNVEFLYGSFTKPILGKSAQNEARVFAIYYQDGRNTLKADNRPQAVRQADQDAIRVTTIAGDFISAIKVGGGTFDWLFWGAAQFGSWGVLDHGASAVAVEAGYQFPGKMQPWVRAGYFRSTGDDDPTDGDHGTFFQILPTPRVYARTPFYNLMNNEDTFVQLMLKPCKQLSLRSDVHFLALTNKHDLWYTGGGAFQANTFGYAGRPSGGKQSLGTFVDVSADYAFTQWTSATFYIGGSHGGDVEANIYKAGGEHPTLHFFYLELNQRF
jgi:hypothetical protein